MIKDIIQYSRNHCRKDKVRSELDRRVLTFVRDASVSLTIAFGAPLSFFRWAVAVFAA